MRAGRGEASRAIVRRVIRAWIAGLLLALLGCAATVAAEDAADQRTPPDQAAPLEAAEEPYRARVREALEEYDRGHYAEALALFQEAYRLKPSARAQRGMALVQFELGAYVACLATVDAALENPRDALPEALRVQLREVRARAARFVGSLRLQVSPARAQVLVDGALVEDAQRPLPLTHGPHTVLITALGMRSEQRSVTIHGGREATLRVVLEPLVDPTLARARERQVRRIWGSVFGVLALGTAAGTTWTALSAHDLRSCRRGEATGATCTNEDKLARVTWASAATTAAGLGLAVFSGIRLWQEREPASRKPSLALGWARGTPLGFDAAWTW
jgi:hypothetical protein